MHVQQARIAAFAPGGGLDAGAFAPDFDDGSWLETLLPADVHSALQRADQLVDPFEGSQESEVAWVAHREWWYRCVIDDPDGPPAAGDRIRIICHGLDTEAELWLNGTRVGEHHSMFRPFELEVTRQLVHDQPNILAIRFPPIVDETVDLSDVDERDKVRIRHRKMQVGFGWDISCYLLTVGVWRPIELRRDRLAALGPVSFTTVDLDQGADRAVVAVGASVDDFATTGESGDLRLTYSLAAPDGDLVIAGGLTMQRGGTTASAYAVVDRPRLWWTHDLGEPHLYTLTVELRSGDSLLDSRRLQVGIRTVELDDSPDTDEPGSRFFRFLLNGRPIFARGANWVPDDLRQVLVSAQDCRDRLKQAAAANMNMIRVWGGGCYEQDAFYSTCDEAGLLVWHDFMFAGLAYPDDDESFLLEAEAEARHHVARLQPHPSLALWCGNNEAQLGDFPDAGKMLFGKVLPRVVAEVAGRTPYWPGSPYGGNGYSSTYDGDTHDWRGFHGTHAPRFGEQGWQDPSGPGRHWKQYAHDIGRFVSEFGFAGPATMATIRHWNSAGGRDPRAAEWQDRIRYVPGDSHVPLLETITGLPDSPQEWVDYCQLIQAEGFHFGIERFRERKPHCSGALLWQLNDCWPGFSWSIIDFDGRPKPAYHAVRRAFAPVLASVNPLRGGAFGLWFVNDSPAAVDDLLTVRIMRFDGTVLHEEQVEVHAEPNSAASLLRSFGWGRLIHPRSCFVSVHAVRGSVPTKHQLFADPRELELPPAELSIRRTAVDRRTVDVELTTSAYVVMVALEHRAVDLDYADNYFSLDPTQTLTVRVHNPRGDLDPMDVTARSLFGPHTVLTDGE